MSLSIEANLRWVRAFLSDEWRLILPVALAFLALPPLALALALPAQLVAMPQTVADLQAIGATLPAWIGPLLLVSTLATILGALTLMALALVPRISVGEAITTALRRAPSWIGAAVLIGAVAFVALVSIGTALMLAGLGQAIVVTMMVLALLAAGLFLVLLLPLVVDRRLGPIAAIREGWHLYRRDFWRSAGACVLVWLASWVTAFAIRIALGSLILMAGIATDQPETGRALAAVLSSVLAALQWSFFYVLVASLYRSRAGAMRAT